MSQMASVTCPECGVVLRKVEIREDRSTRCTGCGHTFKIGDPLPKGDLTALKPEASKVAFRAEPETPPSDEDVPAPKARYGFLVIGGVLLLLSSIAGSTALACTHLFPWIYNPSREVEDCWIAGLVAGLPFLGLLCLLMVRRIGWLDGQVHRLAAILDARVRRMPPQEGSDLPFILPWTVSGGLTVVVTLTLLLLQDQHADLANFAIPSGVLLFAMGLALGELRRFLARMSWACDRVTLAQPRQEAAIAVFLRMGLEILTPCTMVATALVAGVLSAAALGGAIGKEDALLISLFSAMFVATMGGAYSLYCTSRNLAIVVAKSERLARLLNLNRLGMPYQHRHSGVAFVIALLPLLWIYCLIIGRVIRWDFFFVTDRWIEDLPGLGPWTGAVLTAGMLTAMLWLSGVWLLFHRALRSLEAIVESSLPPRTAWLPTVFLPNTLAAFCAVLIFVISASLVVIELIATFEPSGMALTFLGWVVFLMLISKTTDLVDTRLICICISLPALAIFIALVRIPQAPRFMLVMGGGMFGMAIAYAVFSVECLATRIERTRKALAQESG